ncbi:LysR family transcriptional regulator [Ruegeria atlantica]|uniref:LysR family transcriptional regulator n=1 Tax=Ruegeria atlantica TaxID=81569 RepID=UPI001480BF25|nr:LysR family transcriptional regulator [Ruegeria atlantica]
MRFRSFDSLKLFCTVAEKMSFTAAGDTLHMSKGAVSYQIAKLEGELGFQLFERRHTHIRLTPQGEILCGAAKRRFAQLETVISDLRDGPDDTLCVGAHSWFISRWLGPRLSSFTQNHPDITLRVEPINTMADLNNPVLDMTVFWCDAETGKRQGTFLYPSRTVPLANPEIIERAREIGLANIVTEVPLLPDASGMEGWRLWHALAGLDYAPRHKPVHLPDANSRLQAVISGNGIALLDELARPEIDAGLLGQLSEIWLETYGYYVIPARNQRLSAAVTRFEEWLRGQPF